MAEPETMGPRLKKLKRMPHIFSQLLELPVTSDAPVESEETDKAFKFVMKDYQFVVSDTVKVEVVRIVPGAKKVVVRGIREEPVDGVDELDTWRFRLPPSANPDASWAIFEDGVLTVIVPKVQSCKEDNAHYGMVVKEGRSALANEIEGKGDVVFSSIEVASPITVY